MIYMWDIYNLWVKLLQSQKREDTKTCFMLLKYEWVAILREVIFFNFIKVCSILQGGLILETFRYKTKSLLWFLQTLLIFIL